MTRTDFLKKKGYAPVEDNGRVVILKRQLTIVYIVREENGEYIGQRSLEKEYLNN